jgi:hypothetical protein
MLMPVKAVALEAPQVAAIRTPQAARERAEQTLAQVVPAEVRRVAAVLAVLAALTPQAQMVLPQVVVAEGDIRTS